MQGRRGETRVKSPNPGVIIAQVGPQGRLPCPPVQRLMPSPSRCFHLPKACAMGISYSTRVDLSPRSVVPSATLADTPNDKRSVRRPAADALSKASLFMWGA